MASAQHASGGKRRFTGRASTVESTAPAGRETRHGDGGPFPGCAARNDAPPVPSPRRSPRYRPGASWAPSSRSSMAAGRVREEDWGAPFDSMFTQRGRRPSGLFTAPSGRVSLQEDGVLAPRASLGLDRVQRATRGPSCSVGRSMDQHRRSSKSDPRSDERKDGEHGKTDGTAANGIPARRTSVDGRHCIDGPSEGFANGVWPPPRCSLARSRSPQSQRRKAMDQTGRPVKDPEPSQSVTQMERSASTPESSVLLRQCQYFKTEMDYLKEREEELRNELSKARAENARLSAELKHAYDVQKEALVAKRTAREALSEMAQQNARLVSSFVQKRQELRNLQEAMDKERGMWDVRVQTLERQLKAARAEVRTLKKSRTGASETSDSNSDTISGASFSGMSSDDERRSESQPARSPGTPPWEGGRDIPMRTLHEIQVENLRLHEENERLKRNCQSAERKRNECDIHHRAEEIKRNGNQLFKLERYQEAADEYTQGLELPLQDRSLVAVLHCNRASALLNLSRFMEALADCFAAVNVDSSYLRAFQRRADVFLALGDYASAGQDLKAVLANGSGRQMETRAMLMEAQRKANAGLHIDAYRVLGISSSATAQEIKSAYRQLALKYHPDKATNVHGADVLFKLVAHANALLSDPVKRQEYDMDMWRRARKPCRTRV